jgi:phosphotransferase system IIA component
MVNKGDRIIVLDTKTLKAKLTDQIYRSIITKRSKKKE